MDATDYCDTQSTALVADSMVNLSTGFDAFTGETKCTYFLSTAAASGLAPAWKLISSDETASTNFWDYDLVVAEYFTLELSASVVSGTAPYATVANVAKIPEVVDSSAPALMDYETLAASNEGALPMYYNCDFDITYDFEMTGNYENVSV